MLFYNPDFPELIETRYDPGQDCIARMVDTVLSQKDTANYYGGYTFKVADPHGDFKKLYQYFFNTAELLFGKLDLAPRHKTWCWANVYNTHGYKTNMHNHINTGSINCVYYLKMPANIPAYEGGLALEKNEEFFGIYQPTAGDMIIMPSEVVHAPQFHSSEDYRIAINMEISTKQDNCVYYTKERIYEHASPV
jgi:hypothetical protein